VRQIDVLRAIADERNGEIWLGMPVRGHHGPYSRKLDRVLPFRVWNRLMDLGDLDGRSAWGLWAETYLCLTDEEGARLEERRRAVDGESRPEEATDRA
jgi:hypothetical protein